MRTHLAAAFFLLMLAQGQARAEGTGTEQREEALRSRLAELMRDLKTASWYHDSWQSDGKKEERSTADAFWKSPDTFRLNLKGGRGSGAVVIYQGGKVKAFQPGLFSFVKMTFDVRDKDVLSVRGQDMRVTGYFDDFRAILEHWSEVKLTWGEKDVRIDFTNGAGVPSVLWLDPVTLAVSRTEGFENGKVVERCDYSNVRYNPSLEPALFTP